MKIILAGATGFIGRALIRKLSDADYELVLLTRNPYRAREKVALPVTVDVWDSESVGSWFKHLEGADGIVNLAGENIADKRWTPSQKEKIISSRVNATKALVNAIRLVRNKPSVLINTSAVGYYGNVEEGELTESCPHGQGFLAHTCAAWEAEAHEAEKWGVRVVLMRLGVVLGKEGGVIAKMITPFRFFLGGHLGSGKQWFPWIHLDDGVGILHEALQNESLSGPVNAVAPNPVRMKDFSQTLGKVMRRPSWLPVPATVTQLMFGEMAKALLLSSQRVIPKKLQETGYEFRYPTLREALLSLFR